MKYLWPEKYAEVFASIARNVHVGARVLDDKYQRLAWKWHDEAIGLIPGVMYDV